MDFLVSDGAQGDHHHVKAIEPAPAFDEMKTHRARRAEKQQGRDKYLEQAKAMEVQMRLLIGFILDQKKNLTTETRRHAENQRAYRG
jgi:hypothetical protein